MAERDGILVYPLSQSVLFLRAPALKDMWLGSGMSIRLQRLMPELAARELVRENSARRWTMG